MATPRGRTAGRLRPRVPAGAARRLEPAPRRAGPARRGLRARRPLHELACSSSPPSSRSRCSVRARHSIPPCAPSRCPRERARRSPSGRRRAHADGPRPDVGLRALEPRGARRPAALRLAPARLRLVAPSGGAPAAGPPVAGHRARRDGDRRPLALAALLDARHRRGDVRRLSLLLGRQGRALRGGARHRHGAAAVEVLRPRRARLPAERSDPAGLGRARRGPAAVAVRARLLAALDRGGGCPGPRAAAPPHARRRGDGRRVLLGRGDVDHARTVVLGRQRGGASCSSSRRSPSSHCSSRTPRPAPAGSCRR